MQHTKKAFNFDSLSGLYAVFLCLAFTLGFAACGKSSGSGTPAHSVAAANLIHSVSITSPNVTKGSVTISQRSYSASNMGMVGFTNPWAGKDFTVDLGNFDAANDFGNTGGTNSGSLTLTAQSTNYPSELLDSDGMGGAYPVLTSLVVTPSGGGAEIEFVGLSTGCASSGMWQCTSNSCVANASCAPTGAGSFSTRTDWDEHQVQPYGHLSHNTFPHCDSSVNGWSTCPSSVSTLVSGHYVAKYVLMSDYGGSLSNQTAGVNVTATLRTDAVARDTSTAGTINNGGLNLNVIIVGDTLVNSVHTTKGTQNLNFLFSEVARLYNQNSAVNISINQIKVYDWTDANGGSQYSQIYYGTLGDMFEGGSKGVDAADNGNAINIFIVSDITADTSANYTILGLSGAVNGPLLNGTQTSGLAFSSPTSIDAYNSLCASGATSCARTLFDSSFLELASTIEHELGHYLGLNHPTEKADSNGNQAHDQLSDTPQSIARTIGSAFLLDQRACYYTNGATVQGAPISIDCQSQCNANLDAGVSSPSMYMTAGNAAILIDPTSGYNSDMPQRFCSAANACEFNHVMWYTTKNRHLINTTSGATCSTNDVTTGSSCVWFEDGDIFSAQSRAIIQWSPYLR